MKTLIILIHFKEQQPGHGKTLLIITLTDFTIDSNYTVYSAFPLSSVSEYDWEIALDQVCTGRK